MVIVKYSGGLILSLLFCACATTKVKEKPKETEYVSQHQAVNPLDVSNEKDDGMQVEGLMGTLDPQQIQNALNSALPGASRCYYNETRIHPYVGGTMTMKFVVKRDGMVKSVHATESNVGSYDIETCVIERLAKVQFDKPRGGGNAEFTYPLSFPARMSVQEWDSSQVDATMKAWREKADVAKELKVLDIPDGLVLTLYIDQNGRLTTAGMIADGPILKEFATKLVDQMKAIVFNTPQSSFAKVSYTW